MSLSIKTLMFACSIAVTVTAAAATAAEQTINLPDLAFAPEGISNDESGNLFVGSLTQGRIVKIAPQSGDISEFAAAGANGLVSVVGLHVDRGQVFACSSDPGIGVLTGTSAPALVAFDAVSGAPTGRYPLPEGGIFCNDITALPDGTILATDSFAPRVYALRPGADQLEIWLDDDAFADEGFNLNGIAYDDGAVYLARYNTGTLHTVHVGTGSSADVVEHIDLHTKIQGADGLTALGQGRFIVVEGGGLSAGARGALLGVTLENGIARVATIAENLNVPTTATIVGDTAYVVEGQLDHLFDETAGAADPYRILAIELPETFR